MGGSTNWRKSGYTRGVIHTDEKGNAHIVPAPPQAPEESQSENSEETSNSTESESEVDND